MTIEKRQGYWENMLGDYYWTITCETDLKSYKKLKLKLKLN